MSRSVPEWVGKKPESMPTTKVKLRVLEAQDGKCACGCGMTINLDFDQADVDHKTPLKDGGENRESNLQVLLRNHHRAKTKVENSDRAAAERHKAKAFRHQVPKRSALSGSRVKYSRARGVWIDRLTGDVVEMESTP